MTADFWLNLASDEHALLPLLIGLLAFIETLAFIGVAVPGVALLFALSALAGSQQTALLPLLLAAFLGALIGDQFSFLLGRFAGPWFERHRPLKNHPQLLILGQHFFDRYGNVSVIIGRFVGPIRPLIPFTAGSCHMPPLRFTLLNLISALLWAPAYLLPGYLAGGSAQWLPLQGPLPALLIGLLTLLIAVQQIHLRLHPQAGLWHWLERRSLAPGATAAALLLATNLLLFAGTLWAQLSGRYSDLNSQLYDLIHRAGQQIPLWSEVVTHTGDPALLVSAITLLALVALVRHRDSSGLAMLFGLILVAVSNHLLKEMLAIPRPEAGQVPDSYSFPSGHASAAAAAYAMLAIRLFNGQHHRTRHIGYLITGALIAAIALSRTLLGVHWPLDITAGVLEGLIVACGYRIWLEIRPPQPTAALLPALSFLLGGVLVYSLIRTLL